MQVKTKSDGGGGGGGGTSAGIGTRGWTGPEKNRELQEIRHGHEARARPAQIAQYTTQRKRPTKGEIVAAAVSDGLFGTEKVKQRTAEGGGVAEANKLPGVKWKSGGKSGRSAGLRIKPDGPPDSSLCHLASPAFLPLARFAPLQILLPAHHPSPTTTTTHQHYTSAHGIKMMSVMKNPLKRTVSMYDFGCTAPDTPPSSSSSSSTPTARTPSPKLARLAGERDIAQASKRVLTAAGTPTPPFVDQNKPPTPPRRAAPTPAPTPASPRRTSPAASRLKKKKAMLSPGSKHLGDGSDTEEDDDPMDLDTEEDWSSESDEEIDDEPPAPKPAPAPLARTLSPALPTTSTDSRPKSAALRRTESLVNFSSNLKPSTSSTRDEPAIFPPPRAISQQQQQQQQQQSRRLSSNPRVAAKQQRDYAAGLDRHYKAAVASHSRSQATSKLLRRPLEPLSHARLVIPRQRSLLVPADQRNSRFSVLKPCIVHPSDARTSVPTLLREKLIVANGDDCRRMAMMMHFGAYKTIKFWDLRSRNIRML